LTDYILAFALFLLITLVSTFLHELGHIIPIKMIGGIKFKLQFKIWGAQVLIDDNHPAVKDSLNLALFVLGGPIITLDLAILGLLLLFNGPTWTHGVGQLLALINFFLFLINILPIYPLDGWRLAITICQSVLSPITKLLLAALFIVVIFLSLSIFSSYLWLNLLLTVILGAISFRKLFDQNDSVPMSPLETVAILVIYTILLLPNILWFTVGFSPFLFF